MSILTKKNVIDKIAELHQKYYNVSGYMISTVNDELSIQFLANEPNRTWQNTWNSHASKSVQIQTISAKMEVFRQKFNIRLDRPLVKDERYEFEAYFGFGGHCYGFSTNRIIMCFIQNIDKECNVSDLLLNGGGSELDLVDVDFANQSILLLLLGGYVKFWDAIYEMCKWFQGAGIPVFDSTQMVSHLFDKMEIE
jgi:hypothetical protein